MRAAEPDEREAAALILGADESQRGWKRRAVGTSRAKALGEVPRVGVLQTQVPIEPMRAIQRHIQARHVNQAQWFREAIVASYLLQGGDPHVAEAALDMQRNNQRQRDVPRDQFGQDRQRQGRKSNR